MSQSDTYSASYPSLDVCVLIPCYNNLDGLISSLKSIVYDKVKLLALIVDDGSSAPLEEGTITQLIEDKVLVKVINLPANKGITEALNTGLRWALYHLDAKYIARLDCGDICHKDRFYEQVKFLEAVPEVGLLGSWCVFQSPELSLRYEYTTPTAHKDIVKAMYRRNVFIHPTVMFRTALARTVGLYPYNYLHVEDYAYFWQMLKVSEGHILDKPLVTCEINATGISIKNREAQLKGRIKVILSYGSNLFLKALGVAKLKILMVLPYNILLQIKSKL